MTFCGQSSWSLSLSSQSSQKLKKKKRVWSEQCKNYNLLDQMYQHFGFLMFNVFEECVQQYYGNLNLNFAEET